MGEHRGARGQYLILLHITESDNLLKVVAEFVHHLECGNFPRVDLELLSGFVHKDRGL